MTNDQNIAATAIELLSEVSGSLTDLVAAIEQNGVGDVGQALADIVALLEKRKPEAPVIKFEPRIEVHPATPVVSVMPSDWASLRIVTSTSPSGQREFTITKVK